MTLNAPKKVTFIISVILIFGGLLLFFMPFIGDHQDDMLFISFAGGALLTLGNLLKGL
jgi:hypothetical protein